MQIEIKDLKKGMVIYECYAGRNIKMTVLEDGYRIETEMQDGWKTTAETDKGEVIDLFVHKELTHYGPRLYSEPQYYDPKIHGRPRKAVDAR